MTMPTPGASGTDPSAQSGAGSQGDATTPPAGTGAQSGTGTTPPTEPQSGRTFTEAEYNALQARMQAADRRAGENEAALKQLRDKDLPELQRIQRDLADSQALVQQLQGRVQTLQVENSFLVDNTHDWHNSAAALQLLDRSRIQVGDDGTVTGMKEALTALAKEHAYLLKPANVTPPPPPPPGTPPANGGIAPGGNATAPSTTDMLKRFPAMRTRITG